MLCNKCGATVNEDEKFCSSCGASLENAVQPKQPDELKPYGQSANGRHDSPVRKKKLLWTGITAAGILVLAAVLIFVVLAGGLGWPLSGNTTQTKFINDNVRVFAGAFSGINNGTFEKLASEPFVLSMDLTNESNGQKSTTAIDAVYDKQVLGVNTQSNGYSSILLLLNDTLYTGSGSNVSGIKFETDAKLDKPMMLIERLKALFEGLKPDTAVSIDYRKLTEMFVNSIDEKCFAKSGDKTTLTLGIDDVLSALKTFSEKLAADKELRADVNDYIKEVSGTAMDVPDTINMLASLLGSAKDSIRFTLVWEISYKNGAPVSLDISLEDGSENVYAITFGYDRDDVGTNIMFKYTSPDGNSDITGQLNYSKTASGIVYSGSLTAGGQTLSLEGSEKWQGDTAHGEINLSIPNGGGNRITYDETLKFGMPAKSVQEDDRFKLDTSNANVTKLGDMFDALFNPLGAFKTIPSVG